jgi:hypothetical protein
MAVVYAFCRRSTHNRYISQMGKVARGKRPQHKGWTLWL